MNALHELLESCGRCVAFLGAVLVGAGVGAVGGGLYGLCFGLGLGVLYADSSRLATGAAYFALCGAAAGALLGGVIHWDDSAEETVSEPHRTAALEPPSVLSAHWRERAVRIWSRGRIQPATRWAARPVSNRAKGV